MAKLEVKKIASVIDRPKDQKRTMEALGLRKMNSVRVFEDTPQIRGMIEKVKHLVSVKEIN
ncbi:MAG TPA: 50S ribosomal protein L30 [Ignavibacteriales bacterium]|jgi:large subunit ribosomal protein L30|nr:50S ribosomal protein L30 [Ignavibacteriales bacterium]